MAYLGKALIVEDNPLLNRLMQDMVADLGFAVTTAESAADARRAMDAVAFDVLVTDLNLGSEPAGLVLAEEARDHGTAHVVIASGHPMPPALGQGIGYLPKPFTVTQLRAAIGR